MKWQVSRLPARVFLVVKKRPLTSFLFLLALLLVLIASGKFLTTPKEEISTEEAKAKDVSVFQIGQTPRIITQAQVEKTGTIKIVALTGGVVSKINVTAGQNVKKGQTLVSLSSNYQGASAASVQREIAGTAYQNVLDTLAAQKDLIAKQKDLAQKNADNSSQLRDITSKSLDETRSTIATNNDIIAILSQANDLQSKEQLSQFQAANALLNASLRNAEFQTSSDKPPAQIANLSKDIAIKQLEVQEKSLDLNRDMSALQLKLAQIAEAVMFPAAPFPAAVDRIYVKVGESVAPGAPLASLSSGDKSQSAIAMVPREIANRVSKLETSYLIIGNQRIEVTPIYVSRDATDGQLYAILFEIPQDLATQVTNKGFVQVEIPLATEETNSNDPFVPLDAIHQTQESTIVYIIENGEAVSREVKSGSVEGKFIEITEGLGSNEQIILDRNITAGDKVNVITR